MTPETSWHLLLRLLLAALAVINFVVFAIAIGRLFRRPNGFRPGMRAIQILGVLFAVYDVTALLISRRSSTLLLMVAFTICCGSLGLFFWATDATSEHRLSLAFSIDKPRHLLQRGPYRFVRHPFYLAYTLTWLALLFATIRFDVGVSVAIMIALYYVAARHEEFKFRESELAPDYQAYKNAAGMFIPKLNAMRNFRLHNSTTVNPAYPSNRASNSIGELHDRT